MRTNNPATTAALSSTMGARFSSCAAKPREECAKGSAAQPHPCCCGAGAPAASSAAGPATTCSLQLTLAPDGESITAAIRTAPPPVKTKEETLVKVQLQVRPFSALPRRLPGTGPTGSRTCYAACRHRSGKDAGASLQPTLPRPTPPAVTTPRPPAPPLPPPLQESFSPANPIHLILLPTDKAARAS